MRPPVLIVLHGELSTPGRIAIQLRNRDIPLDVRRPRFGDALPDTLEEHTGAIIFGGPQSANDDDEVVKREIDWIAVPLKEKKPYLGICLGAQMLAKHLGARVYKHADGHAEVGYYPIRPTAAGPRAVPRLARPRLSMAPRRLRPAGQGGAARRRRFVSGPGVQLQQSRLRAAIPHGRHARHHVPLDHARPRAHVDAERQAARSAFRRPAAARSCLPRVAQRIHRSVAQAVRGAEAAIGSHKPPQRRASKLSTL